MPKINEAEFHGGICSILAIFTYGLYKIFPVFPLQALCAILLFMGIFNLLRAIFISLGKSNAEEKFRKFEEMKKILTKEYEKDRDKTKINEKFDSKRKNKKSKDDANS